MEKVKIVEGYMGGQTIKEYVTHAKALFPFIPKEQLISMVILHFDIPDKEAKLKTFKDEVNSGFAHFLSIAQKGQALGGA